MRVLSVLACVVLDNAIADSQSLAIDTVDVDVASSLVLLQTYSAKEHQTRFIVDHDLSNEDDEGKHDKHAKHNDLTHDKGKKTGQDC